MRRLIFALLLPNRSKGATRRGANVLIRNRFSPAELSYVGLDIRGLLYRVPGDRQDKGETCIVCRSSPPRRTKCHRLRAVG